MSWWFVRADLERGRAGLGDALAVFAALREGELGRTDR